MQKRRQAHTHTWFAAMLYKGIVLIDRSSSPAATGGCGPQTSCVTLRRKWRDTPWVCEGGEGETRTHTDTDTDTHTHRYRA